jgi:hypothetical protein
MGGELSYTVDGRGVSPEQFFRGIENKLRQAAMDDVSRRIARVRCHRHGQPARISDARHTREGFEFEITGCCAEVINEAQTTLR